MDWNDRWSLNDSMIMQSIIYLKPNDHLQNVRYVYLQHMLGFIVNTSIATCNISVCAMQARFALDGTTYHVDISRIIIFIFIIIYFQIKKISITK